MKKRNLTFYYGIIGLVYSLGYVCMAAFSSVYLKSINLSDKWIGILLSVASLIAAIFQPLIGAMIDRKPKVSSKKVLLFFGILIVAIGLCLILIPGKSVVVSTVLYALCMMFLLINQPFINSLGMEAINGGNKLNLGIGKSMGSMGYAAASYAFGYASVKFGPNSVPIAFSGAILLFCILLFFYPECKADITTEVKQDTPKTRTNPIAFFTKYRRFAVIIVGLILVYFSHSLINSFTLQIVTTKGGDSGDMGTATAIAAVCELITVMLFSFYMKKIKLHIILKISCVFFTLKILFSFIVTNVTQFFIIQGFQMFGWGFMAVGIIYYVNSIMGDEDKAQGQAYAGVSLTVGSVIATFLGGNLIDYFSVNTMLIVGTVAAAIGTVIIWITAKEVPNPLAVNNKR